jgi:hypothetical protein
MPHMAMLKPASIGHVLPIGRTLRPSKFLPSSTDGAGNDRAAFHFATAPRALASGF